MCLRLGCWCYSLKLMIDLANCTGSENIFWRCVSETENGAEASCSYNVSALKDKREETLGSLKISYRVHRGGFRTRCSQRKTVVSNILSSAFFWKLSMSFEKIGEQRPDSLCIALCIQVPKFELRTTFMSYSRCDVEASVSKVSMRSASQVRCFSTTAEYSVYKVRKRKCCIAGGFFIPPVG